jgi:hypothetical protein
MLRLLGGEATALLAPSRQRGGESRLHTRHIPSHNKTFPHRVANSSDTTSLNLGKRERDAKPLVKLLQHGAISGRE